MSSSSAATSRTCSAALRLAFCQALGTQAVQRRQFVIAAGVAGDQVQVGDRDVQLGVFGVGQHQELGDLVFHLQRRQPQIAPDAVVDVHHRRAFAQLGKVLDDRIVGVTVGALLAATALHHSLTEQWAFGNQRQAPFGPALSVPAADLRPAARW
jgi:hypothetical protein